MGSLRPILYMREIPLTRSLFNAATLPFETALPWRSTRRAASVSLAMAAILALSPVPLAAQTPAQSKSSTAQAATQALLQRADSLEARGRLDLATQTWQQVLLADPNNTEALAGLARAAKLNGNTTLSNTYLDRLRAINPSDPNIARIQSSANLQTQNTQLAQAGKYAAAGQYKQAMEIYRQLFGTEPPPGQWALAYYETESATEDGRPHAIAGLRALIQRYPADSRYQVALGRILTYTPRTRAEGRALLARFPNDPSAADAYHQSLLWDAQNPAAASEIRAYLAKHPDPQLATAFQNAPKGKSLSPAEKRAQARDRALNLELEAAYRALNATHIPEADQRFQTLLANNPNNPRVLAGLGYVRMQQSNFVGAISFLEQAKHEGARDPGLEAALSSARFYSVLGQAGQALDDNDLPTAEKQYRLALIMRPSSSEALEGLGGTLLKADQPLPAIEVFTRYTQVNAAAPGAWRGLFMAQFAAGTPAQALDTNQRIPPAIHAQLMQDPNFLRTLASAYTAVGREPEAQRVLAQALELPFPAGGHGLKAVTQLEYAILLEQANRPAQAAGLYRQVLAAGPTNSTAWQGLIRTEHALNQDTQALRDLQAMPPAAREQAMTNAGFEATVAAIYQAEKKLDLAQSTLEKAIARQAGAGLHPSASLETQLAGIYVAQHELLRALPLYHQLLLENPANADAWKGLLDAQHRAAHDREALVQLRSMPPEVRHGLENDPDYLQTVANIYNALNQPRQAAVYLNRIQQHDAALHRAVPANIEIQSAYLFFNGGNDAALYRTLLTLGSRTDLSDEQRRTVQSIWTYWAVRRANQAAATGNFKRSIAILDAASKAFPDNPTVQRALASGYTAAGMPKEALAIFKGPMGQNLTTAPDLRAAVGAAIAANDTKDADLWLNQGLKQYPNDPQMLVLGAKLAQSRGEYNQAAAYYRASLAAQPLVAAAPSDLPGANPSRLPSSSQPLAILLAPNAADSAAIAPGITNPGHPYLPAYAGDAPPPADTDPYGNPTTPSLEYVVPSYMAGSATESHLPGTGGTLKDYVPPTATQLPTGGYTIPHTGDQPIAPPTTAQHDQIQQTTQQAQAEGIPPQGTLASPTNPTPVYGAYFPYIPGKKPTNPSTGQPSVVAQIQAPYSTSKPELALPPIPPPPAYTNIDLEAVVRSIPRTLANPVDVPHLSERDQTALDLDLLDGSLSPWVGGSPYARHRTGTAGFDQLTDFESPTEASVVADRAVRLTVVATPVYMTNGTVNSAALTASSSNPPVLGTLSANTATTPIAPQTASGLGGELQLATRSFGASVGYTPYNFLVPNITGHVRWQPLGRHLTLFGDRDSIKETQLAYAGMRDPGTITATNPGNIWGGVVAAGGGARVDLGGERAGVYLSAGASNLTGYHVLANRKVEATAGTYFLVKNWPHAGKLNIGATGYGMTYTANELGLSYGTGGYFSPQSFFIVAAPVSFTGHHGTSFHYTVNGSVGVQHFHSDFAALYPIDPVLETAAAGAGYAPTTTTGVNYAANAQASYRFAHHWYFGGFVTGNNSNDYDSVTGGFFLRYLFHDQPSAEDAPTGLFPAEGIRPLLVP
jgi:predicted Zn-dependent protease